MTRKQTLIVIAIAVACIAIGATASVWIGRFHFTQVPAILASPVAAPSPLPTPFPSPSPTPSPVPVASLVVVEVGWTGQCGPSGPSTAACGAYAIAANRGQAPGSSAVRLSANFGTEVGILNCNTSTGVVLPGSSVTVSCALDSTDLRLWLDSHLRSELPPVTAALIG